MEALGDALSDLADVTGNDHDLAVLRETLAAEPEVFGGLGAVEALAALLERRQAQYRQAAHAIGRRVYADKPKALLRRIEACWKAWQAEAESKATPAPRSADRIAT